MSAWHVQITALQMGKVRMHEVSLNYIQEAKGEH